MYILAWLLRPAIYSHGLGQRTNQASAIQDLVLNFTRPKCWIYVEILDMISIYFKYNIVSSCDELSKDTCGEALNEHQDKIINFTYFYVILIKRICFVSAKV